MGIGLKKISLLILFFAIGFATLFNVSNNVNANSILGYESGVEKYLVADELQTFQDDEFIIIGNPDNLSNDYLKDMVSKLEDKKLMIYHLSKQNLRNTLKEESEAKEVFTLYYQKDGVLHTDSLSTYSTNFDEQKKEIIHFYNERTFEETLNTTLITPTVDTTSFTYVTEGYKRIVKKPYGYMDHRYFIKKYRCSDDSSLYLVETDSDYVPGAVAYANGDTSYSNEQRNYSGYIHLIANQAVDEIEPGRGRYGGVPIFKDAWPINTPGVITITSGYSIGMTLGYSFKNGFSSGNQSVENDFNIGANISYSYNKSYTNTEPALSTQHGSSNYNQYQWSYQYVEGRSETNHIRTGYLFEMNNSGHDLIGEGQFGLKYDFRMRTQRWWQVIFWFHEVQNPFDGYLYVNWW